MISYLEGVVRAKLDGALVLLVGGVGYRVVLHADHLALCAVGQDCSVFVYTHVREDEISLYGFLQEAHLQFFEVLLSVSGIGPKVALTICGSVPISALQQALLREDLSLLQQVPGVGKKTSERLFLELRDKVSLLPTEDAAVTPIEAELVDALLAMGYSRDVAMEVVPHVSGETLSACVQSALQYLGSRP